ncbi:LysR family transcriptional regulator ArgP [Alloyangia pacifica]|uniref:LysR family transcriptional regulator, chromosome initiation inhibitor n=1 Tax=Alloyangia pacifica TaxID=311180 RepID=A0A1I6WAG6_9RHOB|nr:LysR family transcriptional regulator ArgP [Alloyangia pacifica]SDI50693.1 LysR family transcriptional regulator, chromosome initiation inhibitor [Alloyangia pacifica]SFT22985.1 LysR family transcriptional regulator, chromosome initiation inhibitor [Alloyangia pacifica]
MQYDPSQLAALEAVLRLGSFDAAARQLSVTPSAISQRIKALEDRAGAALVIRATPCTATPAGARLARHASEVALLEAALARDLGQDVARAVPQARLRLAVNADSLGTWFLSALVGLDLLFEIVVDDQAFSADWLRRGEVSAAICDHARPVQGCDAVPLGRMRYIATCAPSFRDRYFAEGVTPETLARAPLLQFDGKDALQHHWLRRVAGAPLLPPTHRLPSTQGFVEAARLGLGWGLNPEILAAPLLASGELVAIRPDAPEDISLTWQVNRLVAPALAPLTRAVRAQARQALLSS